jgi:hypothetical protein
MGAIPDAGLTVGAVVSIQAGNGSIVVAQCHGRFEIMGIATRQGGFVGNGRCLERFGN